MLLGTLGTSLFWNLLTGKGIYRAGKGKGISRACTKNKKRIQKFRETGDTSYIYKNELDKACFEHHMTYGDFKDIKRRTVSDKVLRDKVFNIAKNPRYDGYQRGLASMVYNVFDKKSKESGVNIEAKHNEQLATELHKPIIRNF